MLAERLNVIAPLSAKTAKAPLTLGTPRHLAKGDFFTRTGQPATRFARVLEGLVRHLDADARGMQFGEGVPMPFAESLLRKPSHIFIQALAAAEPLIVEEEKGNKRVQGGGQRASASEGCVKGGAGEETDGAARLERRRITDGCTAG